MGSHQLALCIRGSRRGLAEMESYTSLVRLAGVNQPCGYFRQAHRTEFVGPKGEGSRSFTSGLVEQAPPFVLILHCDMIRIVKVDGHPFQRDSMNTDFKIGDVVRHKSGGKDITIIRIEDASVSGVTKKVAFCGWFEGQNFHEETIPVEMLEFVNRWFVAGG